MNTLRAAIVPGLIAGVVSLFTSWFWMGLVFHRYQRATPETWGPEGPRKLQPGDTVWPNFPVASIPDPTEMEVSAALSEVDHGRIGAGMKTRCILDTYPDRVFEGRIENVGAVAAEAGRSFGLSTARTGFPVRVSLSVTDPIMRPGLSVRARIVAEKEQAVVVRKGLGGRTVVRVAGCTLVECVVESGLKEGDHVLIP